MRKLFLFVIPFVLWSCGDEVQLQEMTAEEMTKAEELALVIQTSFEYNQPQNIINLFDSKKFSKRLGRKMITRKGYSPQFILNVIDNTFESLLNEIVTDLYQEGYQMVFIDTHKKDEVIRLVYSLVGPENEGAYNYFVFYASPNARGELEIVNLYNVYRGLSLGQAMKQLTDDDFNTLFYQKGLDRATKKRDSAVTLMDAYKFQEAYDVMDDIHPKFKSLNFISIIKLAAAQELGPEIYKKELLIMKDYSPNEQSKLFYECIIFSLDEGNEEKVMNCAFEVEELLFKT